MEFENEKLKRKYKRTSMDKMLSLLKESDQKYMVRKGSECCELIFDGMHNVYSGSGKGNFPSKLICLFNMVANNVKKYLSKNPFIELPPKHPVSYYNFDYDHTKGILTATDLDHAYWRIAYIKGYITKKTYEKALVEDGKAIRLASLSILGRKKEFEVYKGNELVETFVSQKKDPLLRKVYDDVRLTCFFMMWELSQLLGDDFDCWKTDYISYRDTPKNRKLVQNYFAERDMLYKQLIYEDDESLDLNEQQY